MLPSLEVLLFMMVKPKPWSVTGEGFLVEKRMAHYSYPVEDKFVFRRLQVYHLPI